MTMHILLVHNPKAARKGHDAAQLLASLAKAGHEVIYQSAQSKGLEKALKQKVDLVLIAGGDGTVAKVADRLAGKETPLSVLPLGTANNLARTLGFLAPLRKLIAQLEQGKSIGFDVGRARGPWGKRYFFEGAGAGLFADYLAEYRKQASKNKTGTKTEQMKRHVRILGRRLQNHPVREWEIELDGIDFSGRYLLWQAMNICSVGPILKLAPDARTNDGWFDFVGVRGEDRGLLRDPEFAAGGRKIKVSTPGNTIQENAAALEENTASFR